MKLSFFRTLRKRRNELRNSAGISAALEEGRAALAESHSRVTALRASRPEILLTADDSELERHERDLRDAETEVEGNEAAIAALEKSLSEAQAAEARAVLEKKLEEARRLADQGVRLIRDQMAPAFDVVVKSCRELDRINQEIRDARTAAKAAGVAFDVVAVEALGCPAPNGGYRRLSDVVVLPDPANSMRLLWGDREQAVTSLYGARGPAARIA
jgi:chromosome segregation ATPase